VPIIVAMPADAAVPASLVVPAAVVPAAIAPAALGSAAMLEEMMEAGPALELEPVAEPDPGLLATRMACRDDGRFALRLGRVVRGQLVPLPPALAGLGATALLAWFGMRNLPGLLLLTPLVVLLLAGFGSAHPHDRGLDWLTPAVLLGSQLLYVAAVGFSFRVLAPLTFTLCALTAVHCASLADADRGRSGLWPAARLGWEARMLIVGVGAIVGLPVVAYAALAAYLAVTTGVRVLPRYAVVPPN
jgi:hypothetical protein